MKFAMFSLMQWPEDRSETAVFDNEIEQAVVAEAQGYDAVWLAEHHFTRYGIGPSLHLTAANIAARTSMISSCSRKMRWLFVMSASKPSNSCLW